jgi:type IV pilus assembly protein PilV
MHTPTLSTAARTQGGFTLLETLIALVVLSIGLLGIAKLVAGAVNANDSGYMRTQATQLAYELLDQMRANRPGASSGAYNGAPANANCATVACAPAVLAGLDLYNWQARVAATLPNGVGAVVTAAGVGGTVANIVVRWDDSQAQYSFGGAPGPMAIALESVL